MTIEGQITHVPRVSPLVDAEVSTAVPTDVTPSPKPTEPAEPVQSGVSVGTQTPPRAETVDVGTQTDPWPECIGSGPLVDPSDKAKLKMAFDDKKDELKERLLRWEEDDANLSAVRKIAIGLAVVTVVCLAVSIPLSLAVTGGAAAVLLLIPAIFGGAAITEGGAWGHQWLLLRRTRSDLETTRAQLKELEIAMAELARREAEEAETKSLKGTVNRLAEALGLPSPFGVRSAAAKEVGVADASSADTADCNPCGDGFASLCGCDHSSRSSPRRSRGNWI